MCKSFIFSVFCIIAAVSINIAAADVKVDFGGSGVLDSSWPQWNATSGTKTVDGVDFTLSNSGCASGPKLRSGVGDNLIKDLLSEEDRGTGGWTYTLDITNLPASKYEITTYFNNANDYDNWGGGTATMEVQGGSSDSGQVPDRVSDYTQALALTLSFTSSGPGDTTTVIYTGTEQPCICGFELSLKGPTVQFASESSGDLETVSPAQLEVILNNGDPGETYTVDYTVTGGTAVGSGIDYTMPGECITDFDDSGQVDTNDLAIFVNNWLAPARNQADVIADNGVDFEDFAILGLQWYELCEPGTLQFNPGEVSKTIETSIVNDGEDEQDETIVLGLSNPTATAGEVELGAHTEHTYTIVDPRPKVSFAEEDAAAPEDVGTTDIPVNLSHSWDSVVTVDYAVTHSTATRDVDYTLADGSLQFDPCEVTENITITIVDDQLEEYPDESIEITLSNPINATLGQVVQHTFTILDNELGESFVNTIGMEFTRIEPGTFTMGSTDGDRDEELVHDVTISSQFYMSTTEVTNAQYEQFDPGHSSYRDTQTYNGQTVHLSSGDNEAVIYVSWNDANAFCQWLTQQEGRPYRLPTEAEWEYACRAGTTSRYYTGYDLPSSYYKNQEHSDWPSEVDLTVKTTGQNSWGLWDMHGNVEEWCYDWYGPYESGSQTEPVGRITGTFRVCRGGSHNTTTYYLRSANRLSSLPEDKQWLTGFRVVCGELPDTQPLPEPPAKQWATNVSQEQYTWPSEYDHNEPYYTGPEVWVRRPSWDDEIPMYGHNHQPAVTWCDNGDLLGAWYSCESERGRELTVLAARLREGNDTWDYPDEFFKAQDRNMHGTALLNDKNGKLYLFNGLGTDYSWDKLALCTATSTDNGITWDARIINEHHGMHHQVIAGPIVTQEGYIAVAADANPSRSAIHISTDNGQTFTDPGANRGLPEICDGCTGSLMGGIHVGFAQLSNGDLLSFGRNQAINGTMPQSKSTDMGQWWTYSDSPFPAIGGGQRPVLLKLEYSYGERYGEIVEAPLLMICFAENTTMLNGERELENCSGMYATVSYDDGQTWTTKKLVSNLTGSESREYDGGGNTGTFTMSRNEAEPAGYLSATQTPDGIIHVCNSRLYYVFNLPWVDTAYTPLP